MSKVLASVDRGQRRCPECGSNAIVHIDETGEDVCSSCGLVLHDLSVDFRPEWRASNPEEKVEKSRVGAPVTILQADKGLTTVIGKVGEDARGRRVSSSTRMQMLRLRKWQTLTQYQSSAERNLVQALAELDKISDKLHISEDLQQEAAKTYRKALAKRLVRGRSISSIVAASVYAACRIHGRPRSLKEIASVSFREKKEIARAYRLLLRELDLKTPLPDPRIYLPKVATKAGVSGATQVKALQLLEEAKNHKASVGKDPLGLTAAVLYIAALLSGEKKTQKGMAEAAGVTEVTVRNRYKQLKKMFRVE